MPIDLTKMDTYAYRIVPDDDVATCLKVICTLRNLSLQPVHFDADVAVVLSHAHRVIVEAVESAQQPVK